MTRLNCSGPNRSMVEPRWSQYSNVTDLFGPLSLAEFGLRGQGIHGQKTDLIHSPTVGETSVF